MLNVKPNTYVIGNVNVCVYINTDVRAFSLVDSSCESGMHCFTIRDTKSGKECDGYGQGFGTLYRNH